MNTPAVSESFSSISSRKLDQDQQEPCLEERVGASNLKASPTSSSEFDNLKKKKKKPHSMTTL